MDELFPQTSCSVTLKSDKTLKVKQSRNRSAVSQRVPGGLDPQIFITFRT